jgi:hypothetical protein
MKKTRLFNCKKCKRKDCVVFQEHSTREYQSKGCQSDYFIMRTFQWRCGFCGYNKIELNFNNSAEIITYE